MEDRQVLLYLIYSAFIEIRSEAHRAGNVKIFHISHLFHNFPLRMNGVENGEGSYASVLETLRDHASQTGMDGWLETRILDRERSNQRPDLRDPGSKTDDRLA